MKHLRLSDDLKLPLDAVTQTFGILAVRGAGKSNLAAVMAEEMYAAGLPFVAVDPVGSWYGLRAAGEGGDGLHVPIFGGRHGDVPLERTGAHIIADLIVDSRVSCVVDVSEFSEGDKTRFLTDFAERLYRRNQEPLHLFLEESDDYIPQKPFREQARCLRAWENIVRRGRARGIGLTLISQRSAVLNKNVLTQVETLFSLRITSPQDRTAIEAWVKYHGQSKEILESLSGLGNGEAWVWSPQWLGVMKRIQVRRRSTFDSGATPTMKGRRAATLADVDLGDIQQRMSDTIERAKENDPKELKAELARVRRELDLARAAKPAPDELAMQRQLDAVKAEYHERVMKPFAGRLAIALRNVVDIETATKALTTVLTEGAEILSSGKHALTMPVKRLSNDTQRREPLPARQPSPKQHPIGGQSPLTGPEQRILNALAWFEAIGVPEPEGNAVAFMAGYSPMGGAFQNPRGKLRVAGFIEYRNDRMALTDAGRALAQSPDIPPTREGLHAAVLARLPGPEQRLLRPLLEAYPRGITKEELAAAAGYAPTGGAFQNPRGRLRTLGLVEYRDGTIVARGILFP